jgi:lipopolysaccharide/colanic/teichoic acid biosynthesis glycosyltransferase
MSKRLFDLLAASAGLIILAPVLLLLGLWVRCDSPGPVLFRQRRVGLHGKLFDILKFRTMVHAACDGAAPPTCSATQLTVGRDARITRAGHVLRRFKLDELPQLVNVLAGSMSLVGPRPEVPRYVACYPDDVRAVVLSVRPGITDWASIHYKDENTILGRASNPEHAYVHIILPVKLAFYQRYVHERGFWTDLRIIVSTLRALLP